QFSGRREFHVRPPATAATPPSVATRIKAVLCHVPPWGELPVSVPADGGSIIVFCAGASSAMIIPVRGFIGPSQTDLQRAGGLHSRRVGRPLFAVQSNLPYQFVGRNCCSISSLLRLVDYVEPGVETRFFAGFAATALVSHQLASLPAMPGFQQGLDVAEN